MRGRGLAAPSYPIAYMAAHLEIIVTGVIVGSTIEIEEAKDREEMVRKVSEFVRNIKSVL